MNDNGRFSGALSVTQLNEYVKQLIEQDARLANVTVKGEISNFKNHYSTGHYYFSLKDEGGVVRAVMFRSSAQKMTFVPENGMKVLAHGRLSAFVRDGQYQLYCDGMEPDGVGALYIAFEQLKRKLEAEGLFDPARKRQLPKIPTRVGIITSPTGAAIRDMINVCGRRFPYATLLLYPSLVQGPDAPAQLIAGLRYFNTARAADVLIIGRGGGSIEDLWAFNNEELAREIAASAIPVISAVGHETDFTISDFVADKRAPTPSAAAELAVPDTAELQRKIENIITREAGVLRNVVGKYRERLYSFAHSRVLTNPMAMVEDKRMLAAMFTDRLGHAEEKACLESRAALQTCAAKLSALDPLAVLSRGYSAVYREDGVLLHSVLDVQKNDSVTVRMADGFLDATVQTIRKEKRKKKNAAMHGEDAGAQSEGE